MSSFYNLVQIRGCVAMLNLEKLGMTEVTCTISGHNMKSKRLHKKCGFIATNDSPINPWGEFEEGRVLYRFRKDVNNYYL